MIEQLMGSRFNGENAIVLDIPSGGRVVNLNAAQNIATSVQFFEQAFEWENLIYICYPYYWGRRNIWSTSAIAATQDPEFDQFLGSGSARLVATCATRIRGSRQLLPLHRMHLGRQTTASAERSRRSSVAQEIQALQTGAPGFRGRYRCRPCCYGRATISQSYPQIRTPR